MADLMARWRIARNSGQTLSDDEQASLNALIVDSCYDLGYIATVNE